MQFQVAGSKGPCSSDVDQTWFDHLALKTRLKSCRIRMGQMVMLKDSLAYASQHWKFLLKDKYTYYIYILYDCEYAYMYRYYLSRFFRFVSIKLHY